MVLKRRIRSTQNRLVLATLAALTLVILSGTPLFKQLGLAGGFRQVDYTILLDTIAKGESKGNYNAYFGNAGNTAVQFTTMSVGEVLAWQENFVAQGSRSSAVGKYQFIRPTLAGLVQQLQIDPSAKFDAALQDKLAIALLERRGVRDCLDKKRSREQFAANLSKEWAALPNITGTDPTASYYAGDGLNHARISIDEVYLALETLDGQDG